MASPTKSQTPRTKEDIHSLKNKIIELERQVNEYRTKLDELRRAKATTTVVKLEKEYVNANIPGSNRPEKVKSCERCEEYETMIDNERKSNSQLKKLIEQKENQNKPQTTTNKCTSCSKCDHSKQLLDIEKENCIQLKQQFQQQTKQTEEEKHAKQTIQRSLDLYQSELIKAKTLLESLKKENEDYKKQFEFMKKEYEDKLNELTRREEDAKKQVSTWEQMYREWMATMERRVSNLQTTNQDLQIWLKEEEENPSVEHRSKR